MAYITHKQFKKAKKFIFDDIDRELKLNHNGQKGGNYLCALGLLCYTEFAGKTEINSPKSQKNFDHFFKKMGTTYGLLLQQQNNIYNIFRCGLAHEFFVKNNCEIHMCSNSKSGLIVNKNNKFHFYIEKYYEDFKTAFNQLEKDIY